MAADARTPIIIVYHADCVDGAACAWTVAKKHGVADKQDSSVTYIPYAHHDVAAAEEKIRATLQPGAALHFVDVAPEKKFLDELMTPDESGRPKVKSISVDDHHESAARELSDYKAPHSSGQQPALEITIRESQHSAAHMLWQKLMPDFAPPPVFDVINMLDGDASGLKTPDDFAAAALVDSGDISTQEKAFNTLRGLAALSFNEMAKRGGALARDQETKIDRLLENASTIWLQVLPDAAPVQVVIVNADVKQFGRQISQRLLAAGEAAGSGVALAWFMQDNGAVTMSIRTDGDPSATDIAAHLRKTMGVTGGGHDGSGAVHFSSLTEFARQMPFEHGTGMNSPEAEAVKTPKPVHRHFH